MKITKLILAAYLLTSMAACDTDKNIAMYGEDSGAIRIEAAINTAFTRSNPGAAGDQQKQFNEGDEIQLSCEDGYLSYVLSEGKWIPTNNYYLRWGAGDLLGFLSGGERSQYGQLYTSHQPATSGKPGQSRLYDMYCGECNR